MFSNAQGGVTEEDKSVLFTGWAAIPNGKGVLHKWSYHPRVLAPTEVEIEISHCGICGTEYVLHLSVNQGG